MEVGTYKERWVAGTQRPGAAGVRKPCVCLRVLVCAPSAGRPFQFGFRSFIRKTVPDVKRTRLFYNQDAYNQEIYVADVDVQSSRNNHDRNGWRCKGDVCALWPGALWGKHPQSDLSHSHHD